MSVLRILAKRVALGIFAAWAVLTGVFAAFTLTEDWVKRALEGQLRFAGITGAELERRVQSYLAARGLDRPVHEQYIDWMGNMVTLQWGESVISQESVLPLVAEAVARSATYVLPAIVLGIVIGGAIGLYAATHPNSRLESVSRGTAYLLFAVPGFWVGGLCVSLVQGGVISRPDLLFDHLLPIALATTTLLGGYVSYSRAHTLEYASAEFITLVRAKGATPSLITVHLGRNAAIPLFSMLFTEALALLVLAVFVIEVLFGIDGFGLLYLQAIQSRDIPVVLGGTLVVIGLGILGNIVQDLSYRYLDPRVDRTDR
ncbi:MAG: ABC transporter permease [Halodesulfurarchaeum sp.]